MSGEDILTEIDDEVLVLSSLWRIEGVHQLLAAFSKLAEGSELANAPPA